MIRGIFAEESGAGMLATALCFWALYAQQQYRIAAGTPEWAIAWAGAALAVISAAFTVRHWIERYLPAAHQAVVAVDRAATVALWLVRLYVVWSVVLLANAVLDSSRPTTQRASIGALSRGEAYFGSFVPLAWADLVFADSGERRRVLLNRREVEELWGGQAVEVQLRDGALGFPRLEAVVPDEEARHRAVLAIAPDAAGSWAELAKLYAKRERWPEALEAARNYLRASSESGTVQSLAAECFQRGDLAHAAEFSRLIFEREKSFKSHIFLGWTLAKLGQHKEALPLLRRAVELNPETFWGYYHLGYAYRYAGQPAEAAEMFREVLKRRPDYPEIEQELRSIGR